MRRLPMVAFGQERTVTAGVDGSEAVSIEMDRVIYSFSLSRSLLTAMFIF